MRILNLIVIVLFSHHAMAEWAKVPSISFPLQPHPIKDSLEYKKELETLFAYQKSRSEDQCEFARTQPHPSFDEMFLINGPLTEDEALFAKTLVERSMRLADRVASFHKKKFARVRPYNAHSKLQPCTFRPTGQTSYPSSHASNAAIGACVLAKIYPAKAQDILDYGTYLGELRVIAGVHYPSDVRAGQILAQQICDHLLEDKRFVKALTELQKSVVQTHVNP